MYFNINFNNNNFLITNEYLDLNQCRLVLNLFFFFFCSIYFHINHKQIYKPMHVHLKIPSNVLNMNNFGSIYKVFYLFSLK